MFKKRFKYVVIGMIFGSILTLSTGVVAETSKIVSAYLASHIRFDFNGEIKKTSSDKPAIIYNDSVYVPVRFIAEGISMPITWDAKTQTVKVESPEPEVIEKIVYKEEPVEKEIEEKCECREEEKEKDTKNYQTLPITKTYLNMEVSALAVIKEKNKTKVFFSVENKGIDPLQLIQSETKIEVDGIPYEMSNEMAIYWDAEWYNDIRKDEVREGYIVFDEIPEDAEGMHIVLKIIQNDGSGKYTEVPFDIKLD
ncbi:stalk domain-containing protein [Defluviitalea phaphyphila]|uniref:stalk domain-containing protein n=1 Tax=Defluviitalea phaphyphila TaxID=1473580 RepID=UPI000731C262|nr:stalk domain-containing protein [Defluviitalea phaphyphila]